MGTGSDLPVTRARTNPNRPREYNRGGQEVDYFMRVVCTDRGQHRETLLTMAHRELDGGYGMSHALLRFAPPMGDEATPGSHFGRDSYVFTCPRCPRTPHVQRDRWWRIMDDAARADLYSVDLSLLP